MLKKTITYEDLNGMTRTEDFYFNLTRTELIEMELTADGGMASHIQRIVDAKDNPSIMREFNSLIKKSYGKKSDDGRRFIKSAEISEAFMQSPAYDVLFMELMTSEEAASKFVNAILPKVD